MAQYDHSHRILISEKMVRAYLKTLPLNLQKMALQTFQKHEITIYAIGVQNRLEVVGTNNTQKSC